jgi:hypothetical protein
MIWWSSAKDLRNRLQAPDHRQQVHNDGLRPVHFLKK